MNRSFTNVLFGAFGQIQASADKGEAQFANLEHADPLGFALEHFDSIGRWRETYRDLLDAVPGERARGDDVNGDQTAGRQPASQFPPGRALVREPGSRGGAAA